jgi:hypothetical protein
VTAVEDPDVPQETLLSDRDLSTQLLAVAAVLDRVKAADGRLRAEVSRRMLVGDRVQGAIDGRKLGTVSMAEGSVTAAVVDGAAFLAWVLEEHPEEVETVPRVKPAFQTSVLAQVKEHGVWADPATGEAVEVPGVRRSQGDPKPVVRKNDQAVQIVSAALAAGKLKEITS